MKIGIDARFAVKKRRGIGNYVLCLIKKLAKIDKENLYMLYVDDHDYEGVLPKQKNFYVKLIKPSNYFLWEQVFLPIQAKRDDIDILHSTGNTAPCFLDRRVKLITTIHDVMYLKSKNIVPEVHSLYQWLGRLYRKIIVSVGIRRADKIVTISEFSKRDILETFNYISRKMVEVIPEAGAEYVKKTAIRTDVLTKYQIGKDYILALGATDPRKNTKIILDAFSELKEKFSIKNKLVIVGVKNWKKTSFFNYWEKTDFKNDIVFLPFIEETELVDVYNNAKVFLYPSLYEGFGFPPLEAMACGIPVITSNITSIPEIVGPAALLINPYQKKEICDAIMSVITDENLRRALIEKGKEQVKKYSWENTAQKTLELYSQVYGDNFI